MMLTMSVMTKPGVTTLKGVILVYVMLAIMEMVAHVLVRAT